jgi:universal stress protein A
MGSIKMDEILVPTDFSRHSRKAFRYAMELARHFGAELTLLHVVDTRMVDNVYHFHQLSPERAREQMHSAAEESMARWIAAVKSQGLRVTAVYTEGVPPMEVQKVATEREVDLIVMGTHGATGLTQLLYGSTAQGVVSSAPCPVLTVDPADEDEPELPETE